MKIHCAHTKKAAPESLVANPRNPNKHSDEQIERLAKIIRAQGWRSPITVSKRSGFIVCGHGRLRAAILAGCEEVPVDEQEFENEASEHAHLMADNFIKDLAEMDRVKTAELALEIQPFMDLEIAGIGEQLEVKLGLNAPEKQEVDAEPKLDAIKELTAKWKTERGQRWSLGPHSLLCGDSTSAEDVSKLLGAAKPNLMVTDPPYGVNYDPKWRGGAIKDGASRAEGNVPNDDQADWTEAWQLFPGNIAYIWHADKFVSDVLESLKKAKFVPRNLIIWGKQHFAISRGDYHHQHEPCWYAVRGKGNWVGGRKQSTLWQIENHNAFGGGEKGEKKTPHSTQKPIDCMKRPIENNSNEGQMVYDPFLGSGITLMAAVQSGRICYGMELDPGYVAVILERYKDATGEEPELNA